LSLFPPEGKLTITPLVPPRRVGVYLFDSAAAPAKAEAGALGQRTAAISQGTS
jgi:hypothetical protein